MESAAAEEGNGRGFFFSSVSACAHAREGERRELRGEEGWRR